MADDPVKPPVTMPFPSGTGDRLPVWIALSELYLDTALDEADLDRIASVLKASPYGRAEIEHILRNEVAPAFSANLLSVAGEWAGWSADDVARIMEQWLERQGATGWIARTKNRIVPRLMPDEWPSIAARLG